MTRQDDSIGVTFNGLSSVEANIILIDFDTFRDRLQLSIRRDEAERLRDALIEKCGEKGVGGVSRSDKALNVLRCTSGEVQVTMQRADGERRTYRIASGEAAIIGEASRMLRPIRQPPTKRNFCPECGARCEYCPECGERLR